MSRRSPNRGRRSPPLVVLVVLAALGACSDGVTMGPGLDEQKVGIGELESYRLGIGDKVRVAVFGEADLSGTFEINATGRISLPLVGEIEASGVDAAGLRQRVTARLSDGFLKSPKVSVEVVGYRPIYVLGEVRNSGEFPFKVGLRLRDVIALAGGYTYRAVTTSIVLRRQGESDGRTIPMDGSIPVLPGDNLLVDERFF